MIEQDTIRLLRECDAGVKMGVSSITEVMDHVRDPGLKDRLCGCQREHALLQRDIQKQLNRFHDKGKDPNPLAEGMSWMKTNAELLLKGSDQTIASLMTDGCNMGIKSLNRYLNEYQAADEHSKDVAKRLIHLEEKLTEDLRSYL